MGKEWVCIYVTWESGREREVREFWHKPALQGCCEENDNVFCLWLRKDGQYGTSSEWCAMDGGVTEVPHRHSLKNMHQSSFSFLSLLSHHVALLIQHFILRWLSVMRSVMLRAFAAVCSVYLLRNVLCLELRACSWHASVSHAEAHVRLKRWTILCMSSC